MFQNESFVDSLQTRCSWIIHNFHRKAPVLESSLIMLQVLRTTTLLKGDFNTGFFLWILWIIQKHFFSIWIFFHEHLRTTGLQVKREGISLTPHYHFHPLHRHLDISRVITAESSPLHIASSRTPTGNLWFPSTSR